MIAHPQSTIPLWRSLVHDGLRWLADRPPLVWRLLAIGLFTFLFGRVLWLGSVVVDGTRYFWLDDDLMISLTYARNLVDGLGLVWHADAQVEGYSNLLWVLVMSIIHLLPLPQAVMPVAVKVVSWGLGVWVLLLSERLLRLFLPRPGLTLPFLLIALTLTVDFFYWTANGFETTLLVFLFLMVVIRLLQEDGSPRPGTYLLLGLIPLVRSDALHVWACAALVAIGLTTTWAQRRRVAFWLGVSLCFPAGHFLWRYSYYGEWLPNTYYLKVHGLPGRVELGLTYLQRFVTYYWFPLILLLLYLLVDGRRRTKDGGSQTSSVLRLPSLPPEWLLSAGLLVSSAYILTVGGDSFRYARFLAHLVPVVLVLLAVAIGRLTNKAIFWQLILVVAVFVWLPRPNDYREMVSYNGAPLLMIPAGVTIDRETAPDTTVATFAIGSLSYYSNRSVIDLLGKADPVIARQSPQPQWSGPSWLGHNKFNIPYSLSLEPDIVIPQLSPDRVDNQEWLTEQRDTVGEWFAVSLALDPTFQTRYLPNGSNIPYFRDQSNIYLRDTSPELSGLDQWESIIVSFELP